MAGCVRAKRDWTGQGAIQSRFMQSYWPPRVSSFLHSPLHHRERTPEQEQCLELKHRVAFQGTGLPGRECAVCGCIWAQGRVPEALFSPHSSPRPLPATQRERAQVGAVLVAITVISVNVKVMSQRDPKWEWLKKYRHVFLSYIIIPKSVGSSALYHHLGIKNDSISVILTQGFSGVYS